MTDQTKDSREVPVELLNAVRPYVAAVQNPYSDGDESDYHARMASELVGRIDSLLEAPQSPSGDSAELVQRATEHADWLDRCGSLGAPLIMELVAALESLASQLAERGRDPERLDWISRQDFDCLKFSLVVDRPHDGEVELSWTYIKCNEQVVYGKTLREAIDAAFAKEQS